MLNSAAGAERTAPWNLLMKVVVHLYGEFRKSAASPRVELDGEDGSTVARLLEQLPLPETVYRMILVNGFRVRDSHVLHDGDEIHLFQPVGGG